MLRMLPDSVSPFQCLVSPHERAPRPNVTRREPKKGAIDGSPAWAATIWKESSY